VHWGCTGARCEVNVGKPDPRRIDTITDGRGLETEDCVMTGDRLYTDIRMALDAGMPSAAVLTDDTTAGDLGSDPENTPECALGRIDHLIPADLRADLGRGHD
jgi:ribonucleotide monophosphatase NagD (HAD superfamily)